MGKFTRCAILIGRVAALRHSTRHIVQEEDDESVDTVKAPRHETDIQDPTMQSPS
jgi:hypothetical protein